MDEPQIALEELPQPPQDLKVDLVNDSQVDDLAVAVTKMEVSPPRPVARPLQSASSQPADVVAVESEEEGEVSVDPGPAPPSQASLEAHERVVHGLQKRIEALQNQLANLEQTLRAFDILFLFEDHARD